ncbi:polysaccharide lyase 6 family protein [Sphingomonas sp. ERG5]|uniref:polysaccharide lyase 6 family protein n=1 Tax=Sphingomonas sp. ERG5 TaxID=1381597 RepID=UPI00054B887C|nr:polysaccharide lyase 6 family protein [Sphingomonas sp. ERG5]
MVRLAVTVGFLALVVATSADARDFVVSDQQAYAVAAARVQPGDTILLADGEWRDFVVRLAGEGSAAKPITLTAQHPGKAILTGRSSLAVAGKYLVVSNLVFRDGHAPGEDVIATRIGKQWAENVRLTGIVIDRFNNPDRRFEDHWVALYGRDIRVDHAHFEGKANNGAMLIVVRDKGWPLDNRIRIDHVYFGPRPPLGSNGGETIRIGTSTESQSDSHTIVEDNYFERCDGEVEIVSVKSGANIVRRNVVVDSQGSVVLRHGNGNLVEDNVFLGHGVPHTGGVRVINERQTVRGNYMEGLAGTDFTSAITVMNGVPNSPINRYLPVQGALIERNSVIDAARITLGAGASAERSQPPSTTRFTGNLITGRADPFRAEASVAGIVFSGNVATNAPGVPGIVARPRAVTLARAANGLLYPMDPALAAVGASHALAPIARSATGVDWYPKPASTPIAFGSGATIPVASDAALLRAVGDARPGDVIDLRAGTYRLAAPLVIDHALTLRGSDAILSFTVPTLFQLEDGGRLQLRGVTISGAAAPHQPGNAAIRTSARPMLTNYGVELIDCHFRDMAGGTAFDVIATTPATLAGAIVIAGGSITDVSGAVVAGHAETGKEGYYGTERVTIDRTAFNRVGVIVDLFRGGTDESTYGPQFVMTGATVTDSGPVLLSGVQETTISANRFTGSRGVAVTHSVGSPHTVITGNLFARTPPPEMRELYYTGPARALIADNRSTS